MTTAADAQLLFFNTLLQLERQARLAKDVKELFYVIANETVRLLPYRQAIVWQPDFRGRPRIRTVSGVDTPDMNAPYMLFCHEWLAAAAGRDDGARTLDADSLPGPIAGEWREWGMGHILWLPLTAPDGRTLGGAALLRDDEWREEEISLGARLFEAYSHALAALSGGTAGKPPRPPLLKRLVQAVVLVLAVIALDQPVRLSVLAPVEIAPREPLVVTSPLNSVIDRFFVEPNQTVRRGDMLFHLDDTETRNQLQVEKKALAILEAEYRQARQKSFTDAQSRARLVEVEAMIARKRAEIDYIQERLERSDVRAGQDGVTVFGSVNDWLGRPVAIGEKILLIADPSRVQAKIMLPVEDAIDLAPGTEVNVFLNIRPDAPLPATLRQASYEAEPTPTGVLAFRLLADLEGGKPPRIGLRGTAKLYGEEVRLWYYLLRRPLIHLRQRLGI